MDEYLSKPIRSIQLTEILETMVPECIRPNTTPVSHTPESGRSSSLINWQSALERCRWRPRVAEEAVEVFLDESSSCSVNSGSLCRTGTQRQFEPAVTRSRGQCSVSELIPRPIVQFIEKHRLRAHGKHYRHHSGNLELEYRQIAAEAASLP